MPYRIAIVCSSTGWGGSEKWALRTCEWLHRRGHQVGLIVKDPIHWKQRREIELPLFEFPFRNDGDIRTVFGLSSLFRKKFDIIIPVRVRDYLLAGLAAGLSGKKVLLRLGVVRKLRDNYLLDRLRYSILPHRILVNAEAIREALLATSWMAGKKIHVIRNGVDAPGLVSPVERQKIRHELEIPDETVVVVGAGRLAVEKRWDWMVKAVAAMIGKGIPVSGWLLGEGNQRETIEKAVRLEGVQDWFHFTGLVESVTPWLKAADIVMLPSSNEGISNFMLEAMGHSLPVVATTSGGVEEVFSDGEELMLAAVDDQEKFIQRSLQLAVSDSLRSRIGKNALETVQKKFTWDAMCIQLEDLFLELTGPQK